METDPLIIQKAKAGDVEAVIRLLQSRADVNARSVEFHVTLDLTPLMLAAKNGDTAMVELLLNHGANVNAVDKGLSRRDNGAWSALHYATAEGHITIVQKLLSAGADANAKTTGGDTPLCFAASTGKYELVRCLIEEGASARGSKRALVNAATISESEKVQHPKYGEIIQTHSVSDGRNVKLIEYLLSNAANVNSADEFDYTALHEAAYYGNCPLIELLLDHNANPNTLDKEGRTPLDRAEKFYVNKNTRTQTLALLRAAGARRSHELLEVVEARKRKKRPNRPNFPRIPDFSEAGNSARFREQLSSLQTKIGTQPQPLLVPDGSKWVPVPGGLAFTCSRSRIARIVEDEHVRKLQEGVSVFVYLKRIHMVHTEHQIGILPTADKYQVVLAIRPYGPNEGVDPQDIADELKKIDAIQPFHVIGIGLDQITLHFPQPIADGPVLGSAIAEFPADAISRRTTTTWIRPN